MPYDLVDAYLEIKELQENMILIVQKLKEKKIIEEEPDGKEKEKVSP